MRNSWLLSRTSWQQPDVYDTVTATELLDQTASVNNRPGSPPSCSSSCPWHNRGGMRSHFKIRSQPASSLLSVVSFSFFVSKTGVDPGVKMNGNFHRNALLSQKMLPAFKSVAGDTFIFQQDNAPVHGGNESSPFSCCNERPPTSSLLIRGGRTTTTWTRSIGKSCSGVYMRLAWNNGD